MSKTKVIEVLEGTQMIMQISTDTKNRVETVAVSVDDLETLNSNYINEHFSELQDAAYEGAYQKGLTDAWEIAKKISIWDFDGGYSWKELRDIFGTDKPSKIYTDNTPVEAIAKLKAYEEQKIDDEVRVGDEVESLYDHRTVIENTIPWVVTKIREGCNGKKSYYGIDAEGTLRNNDLVRKTGRRFGINKILEEMKE